METITFEALLGATAIEVAVRILWAFSGGILTMIGFWGLRRRIKALEDKDKLPPTPIVQTFNISPNPQPSAEQQPPERLRIYDEHNRTVCFGAHPKEMRIRFHDAETIMDDISHWLRETGYQRSVPPEAVKRVMRRLRRDK